ncbi:MAG TPA: ABC transporter substrate-binding protein, partial [Aggregatilineales bacterium]|nr:ABC transporter substrate-binding protein [Aggregatilineales bacterium]
MKRTLLGLFSLVMVSAGLFPGVSVSAVTAQSASTTVTIAFPTGDPSSLDPQAAGSLDESQVIRNVYEGLVTYDSQTLAPAPALATKWTVSSDSLTYTFTLRQGVTFQNGQPFSADDVKFTFDRLANPDTGTSYTSEMLNGVHGIADARNSDKTKRATELTGVKVIDPQTVQFTLDTPVASFLQQLAMLGGMIVPKGAGTDLKEKPVGTGPYMLKEWVRQQTLTLVANPKYWGGAPSVQTVVFKNIPQATQQAIEFQGGNLDLAWVSAADLPRLTGDATLSKELQNVPTLSVTQLRINLKDPVMSKPEVREALWQAIDRDTLVKTILNGQGSAANQLIPPGLSAFDKTYNPFPYDSAKAKALLAGAGYPSGITLEVRTGTDQTQLRILQAISQQVADAGITLNVNSTETTVYNTDRGACKMQMGSVLWTLDYPDPDNVVSLLLGPSGSRKNCGYDSYPQEAQVASLL